MRATALAATGAVETRVRPGWLYCNGAAVSRQTYKKLFDRIGTTFGVGDGSTTFNLPDYRGRHISFALDGQAAGGTRMAATAGTGAGEENHTLTKGETPRHTHDRGNFAVTNGGSHGHTFGMTMVGNNNPNGPSDASHALCAWQGGVSVQTLAIFVGSTSNDPHTHPSGEFSGVTGNGSADSLAGTAHSNVPPSLGCAWMVAY
jgi:microcystin-dependent protein